MAAYAIGAVQAVNDPAGFLAYQKKAGPTVTRYGGKIIVGGTDIEAMDGNWVPIGMIVVEFESMAKAKERYNSPEYQAIQPERIRATDSGLILINGDRSPPRLHLQPQPFDDLLVGDNGPA